VATHRNQPFINQSLAIDGERYEACRFHGCTLTFSAGDGVVMEQCQFEKVNFRFGGGATRTLQFLTALYHSGDGGKEAVEALFDHVRQGNLPN
jgi:hypothetical protein